MNDHRRETSCGSAHGDSFQMLSCRRFLTVSMTGAAIVGAGGLASCMTGQPATRGAGATPKPLALYQDVPNKGRRCAECTHFLEPNACDIVAGEISPTAGAAFINQDRTDQSEASGKRTTLDLIEESRSRSRSRIYPRSAEHVQ